MHKKPKVKHPSPSSPVFTEVAPNAARTLAALREMGYDSFASIMDLLDNAVDAGATRVDVWIKETGKSLTVEILDNGRGMDANTLAEALRLGSATEHSANDLGKFGMGLVTASLSMARSIYVVTRQDGKPAYEADFDLDVIERENKFVITLKPAHGKNVIDVLETHGTLVKLSNIDRINDRNVARFAGNLRTRLGQVYRHFIENGVEILVNGRKATRYDPLMLDNPQTEIVLDTKIDLGDGTEATLKVVELPELGTQGDAEANIFPHNSGFYVVRNGREIIAGETFGFYRHHHSYSHFRAELAFTGQSTVFHEDIKKSSIHPDDRLLDKLKKMTERLIALSGRRGRDRSGDEPIRLNHKSAQASINDKFGLIASGVTPAALASMRANLPPAPEAKPEAEAPRKRGRPTKEETAKREAEEAVKQKQAEALPQQPRVEFVEVDGGEKGRFFTADTDKKGNITVQYNSRHPFVRLVADSKQPKVAAILDMLAFALAKAEVEVPDGRKLVNKACDYLAILASPSPGAA